VTEPLADGVDDLRHAVDLMRGEQLPFIVHVRADLPAEIEVAQSLGLVGDEVLPGYALEPGSIPAPPSELSIERVDGADFESFLDTMIAGFDLPRDFAVQLFRPRVLEAPGVRGYLGTVDGRSVATAMSMRTADTVGIYSVATLPEARGRGYGTALTWMTLADVDPGVQAAVLQASPMGRSVYERMGFRLVREFLELGQA
jgi:ribosomal protein S18 acetylase RimI-like enzyme